MVDQPPPTSVQVLYLEPDDEIPSVVRRLDEVQVGTVILVAPGRGKATSSAIGLRLLARHAEAAGLALRLVADPASRLLAAEAGIAAYASLAEAQEGSAAPAPEPPPRPRAAIHVVRGERPTVAPAVSAPAAAGGEPPPGRPEAGRTEDTQAVPTVAAQQPGQVFRRPRRRWWPRGRRGVLWAAVTLLLAIALVVAVLPGATIQVTPQIRQVGPLTYTVDVASTLDSGELTSTLSAAATGTYDASKPAKGSVSFNNYNSANVTVPKATRVSAGSQVFKTDVAVVVPRARRPGLHTTASVAVTAVTKGPDGNVGAYAIDTINDTQVANQLCGFFPSCPRLIANGNALSGGATQTGVQITQDDVDGLVAHVGSDLAAQLQARIASHPDRVYLPAQPAESPSVPVPEGLVGTKDQDSFSLTGTLSFARRYVLNGDLRSAATAAMQADTAHRPAETTIVDSSVKVSVVQAVPSGDQVSVTAGVQADVAPILDQSELKARVAGKSRDAAIAALSDVGPATVQFWPGWVSSVPILPFRIDIQVEALSPSPSPSPGVSSTPSAIPTAQPSSTVQASPTAQPSSTGQASPTAGAPASP